MYNMHSLPIVRRETNTCTVLELRRKEEERWRKKECFQ
nr:MAG TPA: hypothetical protein [Bacteriophage sp.]